MKTATALRVLPTAPLFGDPVQPGLGQIPLPFTDLTPVVPAPIERDALAGTTALRQKVGPFMQALVEVLSGERPARQMAAWMSTDVYGQLLGRLTARARVARRLPAGSRARVMSLHVAMVSPECAEVAARFIHRGRSRALAVRLELRRNHRDVAQWLCTAVVWG